MEKGSIYLISGKAQHGKGSASLLIREILAKEFNTSSEEINYGDYLKYMAKQMFGWNGEKDKTGRQLLQYLGTDVCRKNNPDIWVNVVMETIKALKTEINTFVISDVRFPNEIEKVYDLQDDFNIHTVRVFRPRFEGILTKEQKLHISETALDDWDFDFKLMAHDLTELKEEVYNKLYTLMSKEA